jgi:hypothetical protein
MKIYNFGNDYAFQQKQKLEQEVSKMNPSSDNKVKEESNVENQNSDAGSENEPVITKENDKPNQVPETAKKKKEAGAKGWKKQEDSQV